MISWTLNALLIFQVSRLNFVFSNGIPPWNQRTENFGQPVDIMTDVINNLGVQLLDCYADQPGNVAFSPTGLAFVLAALYEGSAGRTSRQISQVLSLPRDRRITRIGLRDIHRRLRSYLNADAFLGGLTLNRDDINLRPEYEEILRFYGFDVGLPPANITNINTNNSTNNSTSINGNLTDGIVSTSSMADGIIPTSSIPELLVSTTPMTNVIPPTTSTPDVMTIATIPMGMTTNSAAEIIPTDTTASGDTTGNFMDMMAVDSMLTDSTISMDLNNSTISTTTVGNISSNENQTVMMDFIPTVASVIGSSTVPQVKPIDDNNSLRKKRSFNAIPAENIWLDDSSGWRGYNIPPEQENILSRYADQSMTELNFLINGYETSTISTATYTAILPFAYIPALNAFSLEFPLDDPRYNVILILPNEGLNSRDLIRLLLGKTLRHIRETMRPTWVKASIPSFMLRGFITLTPYLQKLGIRDAFEPRAADLSPMSPDLGVYARDVQQNIGVNIRNYMKEDKNINDSTIITTSTPNTRNAYPPPDNLILPGESIQFIADRPFLFFIVDAQTSVSLIAGRIDDPLNSRIL